MAIPSAPARSSAVLFVTLAGALLANCSASEPADGASGGGAGATRDGGGGLGGSTGSAGGAATGGGGAADDGGTVSGGGAAGGVGTAGGGGGGSAAGAGGGGGGSAAGAGETGGAGGGSAGTADGGGGRGTGGNSAGGSHQGGATGGAAGGDFDPYPNPGPGLLDERIADWRDVTTSGSSAPPAAGVSWQRVDPNRTTTVTFPKDANHAVAMRFDLEAGDDPINSSGTRVEWADFRTDAQQEKVGTEGFYAFSFYLPDGTSTTDPAYVSGSGWTSVWQLHHSANTGSPPFAVRIDGGKLWIATRDSPSGTELQRVLVSTLPIGQWIRLIFYVKWDVAPNGSIETWARIGGATDWSKLQSFSGITTYYSGDPGGYWKGGIYEGEDRREIVYSHGFARLRSFPACRHWHDGP